MAQSPEVALKQKKEEDRERTKRTIPFGVLSWRAARVHKRGQTTRTIPICQPLFAEINSRDVRWMQLPRRIGARMHFFAPSRVKPDRENFTSLSEATASYARHRRWMGRWPVNMWFIRPRREPDMGFLKQCGTLCIASIEIKWFLLFLTCVI